MTEIERPTSVAIVTGAASGIGRATAQRLLASGWRVAVADLAPGLADRWTDVDGQRLLVERTDVTETAEVERLVHATVDRFGRLDAVANVAGVTFPEDVRIEDLDVAVFDRTHAVNMRGTFLMCRAAIPMLRASGGGAVVNLGSVASLRGAGGTAYVSSKAGVAGLTRAIAVQYAAEGIRATTVAPGPTDTPMLAIGAQKSTVSLDLPGTIRGQAEPDEVAALIEFLLSDSGRYVTGSIHAIDGESRSIDCLTLTERSVGWRDSRAARHSQ